MLLGEHAVLHGYSAVVCAIDRRIIVTLLPQKNRIVTIKSALGEYQSPLDKIEIEKPFKFILAAIKLLQKKIPSGFVLNVQSEFSDKVGLGSSAAVTVATLAALHQWLFGVLDEKALYRDGMQVVQNVQGVGSGSDIVASIYGGIIDYNPSAQRIQSLKNLPNICLIYSGYKTPTTEVIDIVKENEKRNPGGFKKLYSQIDGCVKQGVLAIESQDWSRLGNIFNEHQALQNQLGVNDDKLQRIIDRLLKIKSVLGAKISGSGLGDCVVALGDVPDNVFIDDGLKKINVHIVNQGIVQNES